MIKRLRRKFVCVIMAIMMLMLATILGVAIHFTARNLEEQSIRMMRSFLNTPGQPGARPKPDGSGKPPSLPGEVRLPCFALRLSPQGEVVEVSGHYFDLSDREYLQLLADTALQSQGDCAVLKDYGLRYLKDSSPQGLTIVFCDITSENSTLKTLFFNCSALFFGGLILFFLISLSLSHWVILPTARAWEQQRQFIADASHELKTPLSIILANAELLQSEDSGEGEQKQFAQSILTTSYQMRSLVESLLEIARVDNGSEQLHFENLDFSQLVSDAVLSFQLLYEEQHMALAPRIPEGIFLSGSEQHLFQVLDVLLDNALKYGQSETTVTVTLTRTGGSCLLSVFNQGQPLTRDEQEAVFKRFYRADKARSRNGSYGLGLPIAQAIVTAHKGKIWVQSDAKGNTFHVQLPLTDPNPQRP